MVESRVGQFVHRKPFYVIGHGAGRCFIIGRIDQCIVGNGDYTAARIAIGLVEAVQLFQVKIAHAQFAVEDAVAGLLKCFGELEKGTGEGPPVGKGRFFSVEQQYLELSQLVTKNDQVDCQRGVLVLIESFQLNVIMTQSKA